MLLLASEFFSQLSVNLLSFSLLIVVFSVANSNTAVSGVALSFMLPSLFFGVIAGVLVDRWNKKNVLFFSNLVRAGLALLLVFTYHNLLPVYIISFLSFTATQFFIPAETPMIPLLVDKKLLFSANALFSLIMFGSIMIAYAVSGPLILLVGKTNLFIVLTVFFVLASVFAFLIRIKKKDTTIIQAEKVGLIKDAKNAFVLIAKTKKIYKALFLLTFLQTLILMIAVIGPGYARDILHIRVEEFSILFVIPAVLGMATGALLIGNFLHTTPKSIITKIGLVIMGITLILFPYGSKVASREFIHTLNSYLPHTFEFNIIHIMIVLAYVLGFSFAFVFVPSNTIIQEETTDEFRGKVYGALSTLSGAASIIPVLAVGTLSDIFGVAKVLTTVGVIVLAIAFARFLGE